MFINDNLKVRMKHEDKSVILSVCKYFSKFFLMTDCFRLTGDRVNRQLLVNYRINTHTKKDRNFWSSPVTVTGLYHQKPRLKATREID